MLLLGLSCCYEVPRGSGYGENKASREKVEEKGGKRREVLGGVDLEEPRLLGSGVVVQEGGSRGKKNKKTTGGRRKVTIVAWQSWRNKQMGEEE